MNAATMQFGPGAGEAGVTGVRSRCSRDRWPALSGPRSAQAERHCV